MHSNPRRFAVTRGSSLIIRDEIQTLEDRFEIQRSLDLSRPREEGIVRSLSTLRVQSPCILNCIPRDRDRCTSRRLR